MNDISLSRRKLLTLLGIVKPQSMAKQDGEVRTQAVRKSVSVIKKQEVGRPFISNDSGL